jgi:hypothetical protein
MAQAVRFWSLAKEAQVLSQVSPCEICGGQSGSGRGVSTSTSILPCWYHFQQCFILILIYLLFQSEGQLGEAWETSKSIRKSGRVEHSNILFILKNVVVNYVMEPLLELAFIYVFWIEISSTTLLNSYCYVASNTELRMLWRSACQLWANAGFARPDNPPAPNRRTS